MDENLPQVIDRGPPVANTSTELSIDLVGHAAILRKGMPDIYPGT
jgi:hypothetical protein